MSKYIELIQWFENWLKNLYKHTVAIFWISSLTSTDYLFKFYDMLIDYSVYILIVWIGIFLNPEWVL